VGNIISSLWNLHYCKSIFHLTKHMSNEVIANATSNIIIYKNVKIDMRPKTTYIYMWIGIQVDKGVGQLEIFELTILCL
jgi:hypothetical protein